MEILLMHRDADIDHLEELLRDIEVMPNAMCVSELDGYFAGLLLCPEMIMPSEWLPEVWGLDGEPEFASMEQAQATIGAVMAHYNRVAERLANPVKPYEIVLEEEATDGSALWEFWIAGFYQAKCSIPDDHIEPRRSALFMARSILREVRDGDVRC